MIKWRHNFNKQGLFFQLPNFLPLSGLYTEDFEKSFETISEEIEGSIKNTGEFKCGKIYFIEII